MSYLILSIVILLIGILGIILNRSNLIIMLMCVELVLLASTVLLLFESRVLYTLFGQIFCYYDFNCRSCRVCYRFSHYG